VMFQQLEIQTTASYRLEPFSVASQRELFVFGQRRPLFADFRYFSGSSSMTFPSMSWPSEKGGAIPGA